MLKEKALQIIIIFVLTLWLVPIITFGGGEDILIRNLPMAEYVLRSD